MLTKRIIPCLDVKGGRTVKGTQFLNLRDAGDPVELASRYSAEGADELVFLDITATQENRSALYGLVERVARAVRIPFTVGGGISSLEDIERVLLAGADKISLNSAIIRRPSFLDEAARRVGSQSVVAAIDAKREGDSWKVWSRGGTEQTELDAREWAREAVERGAGELLVTSMDRDGSKAGYDVELLRTISEQVRVPVIASGGAGTREHFFEVLADGTADAALAASLFHYRETSITEIKIFLRGKGIPVRL
ncbi:MAG TPA: imidazole glycerol phosphate synthase subunit HisF [Bacteroidota bacterium]